MRCQKCGERFAEFRTANGYDEYPWGETYEQVCTHGVCPICGADELEQETVCAQCGCEVARADMKDGFCRFCSEELEQTLEWICSMLTPAQQNWMLEHPEWVTRGETVC